jgi:site-specific recombinase XerD
VFLATSNECLQLVWDKCWFLKGMKMPAIFAVYPFPFPGHPDKLRNHAMLEIFYSCTHRMVD